MVGVVGTARVVNVATGVEVLPAAFVARKLTHASSVPDDGLDTRPIGVAGPPAVTRAPIQPRARQQRGRKRK